MVGSEVDGALGPLGIAHADETVFRAVLRLPGSDLAGICVATGCSSVEVAASVSRLSDLGLVSRTADSVVCEQPEATLDGLAQQISNKLQAEQESLSIVRLRIAGYVARFRDSPRTRPSRGSIDVVPPERVTDVVVALAASTSGEMLWLWPDQWVLPTFDRVNAAVTESLHRGRRTRSLYPWRAIAEAGETMRDRVSLGEQVRMLPSLPGRLAIFGAEAAMIPETWSPMPGDRLVIRHPGLVQVLRALFELLWERGTSVPGLGGEVADQRRQLLSLLAGGAIDEQMARALGVSLRTVRRRIAALMSDLGVDSRFQAGVEAVRRGWL